MYGQDDLCAKVYKHEIENLILYFFILSAQNVCNHKGTKEATTKPRNIILNLRCDIQHSFR